MVGEITKGMVIDGEVDQGLTWGSGVTGTGPGYFSWPPLASTRPGGLWKGVLTLPSLGIYPEVKGKS